MLGKIDKSGTLYNGYDPHPFQKPVHDSNARFRVCVCGRRSGKDLWIETPILTSNGFKLLKNIQDGDVVFDENGNPCNVIKAKEILYNRPCYKITFSDGSEIIASNTHDWVVEDKSYRKNISRNPHTKKNKLKVTTKYIHDNLMIERSDGKKETNFSIPVCKPVKFSKKDLLLDPYFLGLWLGDGDSNNAVISKPDEEIITYLMEYASSVGDNAWIRAKQNKCPQVKISHKNSYIYSSLKHYKLLNNKHIPHEYLTSSKEQRLELIQGLIDSDGYIKNGRIEFCNTNKRLAEDVLQLILSMGIKASLIESDAKLYGIVVSKKYRIYFTTDQKVARLTRKANEIKLLHKSDIYRRFIVACEPVDSVPTRCLAVDSPSHLFLCGKSLIPTHNTTLALNEILKAAWVNKDKLARIWYVAPNYRQAKTVAWEMIKEIIPEQIIASVNEAELMIRLVNGSIIELKGADAQDSLRGSKIFFVVLDEYASMKRTVWEEIIRPSMADVPGSKAIFIGTPAGMHNHFKTLYDKASSGKAKDWAAWTFKTGDNPYVSNEELEELRKGTDPTIFKQEYEAEFVEMAGAIYPMFKREIHCVDPFEIPEHYERVVGMDWGMRNATAIIFAAISNKGEIIVYDTLYGNGKTVSQWANIIRGRHDYENITQWIIDPAALAQAREFGNYGINFISYNPETLKKINDVNIGINLVQQYLLEGKIKIFKHCDVLIDQMEQYQWEPSNSRLDLDPRPKPLKKDDHACFAAGTKVLTIEGNKSIETLKVGDLVLTRNGYKPIEFIGSVGEKQTNQYLFSNGEILEATPDHPLIINNEKIPIDSLWYCDKVESWTSQTFIDQQDLNGANKMVKFLKDTIFTIKMVIQEIIISKTLNAYQNRNILSTIGINGEMITKEWNALEKTSIEQELKLQNGMDQKKELNGIENMLPNMDLGNGNQDKCLVKYVINPIKQLKNIIADFVLTTVNLLFVVPLAWIMLSVNVHIAQKFLKSINILLQKIAPKNADFLVAKIKNNKKQKVYNLTVKDNHEYYANGILVSNCDGLRYLCCARMVGKTKTKEKYKGLDPQSELFWRSHNNDLPQIAKDLMPTDNLMYGVDESYATYMLEDL